MSQALQEIEFPTENILTGNISIIPKVFSESIYKAPSDGFWEGGVYTSGNVIPPFKLYLKAKLQSDYVAISTGYTKGVVTSLHLDPNKTYSYDPPGGYKNKGLVRLYPISDYRYSISGYFSRLKIKIKSESSYILLGSQITGHVKVETELHSDYYFQSTKSVNDKCIIRLLSESSYSLLNTPVYLGRLETRLHTNSTYFYEKNTQSKSIIKLELNSDYLNIPSPAYIAWIRNAVIEMKSETISEFGYEYSPPVVIEDSGTFLNSTIDIIYNVVDAIPEDALDISLPIWATLVSSDALNLTATITAMVFNRTLGECNITCMVKRYSKYTNPKLKVTTQLPTITFGEWE